MHTHRIPADPSALQQALLALLVEEHDGLWSLAELDRCLHSSRDAPPGEEPSRTATEDAVEDLYAAGLVHRIGSYVTATRAARAAGQLHAA